MTGQETRDTRHEEEYMQTTTKTKISGFRDLRVWQEGMTLAKEVYQLCSRLPKAEIYGLSSQMKRAAISIPSNIAEGHSRNHRTEYRQYIYIALGSLAELETQLNLARDLDMLETALTLTTEERINYLRAMLITLGKRLSQ